MRERPDGKLEAETFEEHMRPDVVWVDDPHFAREFDRLMAEKQENLSAVPAIQPDPSRNAAHHHGLGAALGIFLGVLPSLLVWAAILGVGAWMLWG